MPCLKISLLCVPYISTNSLIQSICLLMTIDFFKLIPCLCYVVFMCTLSVVVCFMYACNPVRLSLESIQSNLQYIRVADDRQHIMTI